MFPQPIINNPTNNTPSIIGEGVSPAEFSFFNCPVTNKWPSKAMTIWEVYLAIKSNQYQPQTAVLRTITDKAQARSYKAQYFDYCTFSGTFTSRKNEALIQHSGLMTIDLDHLDNVNELKTKLLEDINIDSDLLLLSPSGNGLKCIVSIDLEVFTHLEWFSYIENYFKIRYHLPIDPSGKDVSRACFLPFDSEVYINPKHIQA